MARFASRLGSPSARALGGAGACVLGLALTWGLAALVPTTHAGDAAALNGFTQLGRPRVDAFANDLLQVLGPLSYTLMGSALVAIALVRRRALTALAAAIVLALAPLTSETLKPLLAHSHDHFGWSDVGGASWPSGHSTAAMTLVMCALLVSPRRWRAGVAVLGSIFALAVGFSLLILAWHLPSDVLGGYLVAAFWAALAVAVLRAADARRAPAKGATLAVAAAREGSEIPALVVPALVLAALGAAIAGAALLRPNQVASFASQHHWVVLASLGLASLAALIPTTLASALRR